jgi:hypothetical protein
MEDCPKHGKRHMGSRTIRDVRRYETDDDFDAGLTSGRYCEACEEKEDEHARPTHHGRARDRRKDAGGD